MENIPGGIVVRAGQLTGDTMQGVWNEAEVFPAIVRSSIVLESLPDSDPTGQEVSWLPVDVAANVTTRILVKGKDSFYNLVNPYSTPYSMISDRLTQPWNLGKVDILPYREWVQVVQDHNDGNIPTTPLIRHLDQSLGAESPLINFKQDKLKELLGDEYEETFISIPPEFIDRLVSSWRERGLLDRVIRDPQIMSSRGGQ
jgi:thioester reductase-like protein